MTEDPTRVPCPLRSAALASPGAGAVVGTGWAVSYEELDRCVSAAGRRIGERGFEPGSRVALYLPKGLDYVVLLLAAVRAGLVACPVSTRLPAGAVAPLLSAAGCAALISDARDLAGAVDGVDVVDPGTLLGGARDERPPEPLDVAPGMPATIVFTSGSTAAPKAALHTFGNHYYSALGSNENIELWPGDRWLHSLPLYHVGGISILFRCLLAGATVALPGREATVGGSIPALRATHVSLVSTQLSRLLREGDDLSGLKAVLMGGGPIPSPLVDRAVDAGLPLHTSYGLTEMASQVTTTPSGASRDRPPPPPPPPPRPPPPPPPPGEILVRGSTLFAGYARGGEVSRPLDEGGWFPTGDLGEMDADGYLRMVGRRDNLFVSGGENVQPEEIEEALCRIEGVQEAVVVPVPDGEYGARPVAFVRMLDAADPPPNLAERLSASLPRFKVPDAFYPWPDGAPRTAMKTNRAFFRERARQTHA